MEGVGGNGGDRHGRDGGEQGHEREGIRIGSRGQRL